MVAAALSCSLLSTACVNLQVGRAEWGVITSSKSSERSQLAWDPLRSSAMVRSSTYLSSSSSIVLRPKSSVMQSWSRSRLMSPRVSSRDGYDELEQVPEEVQEAEIADRDHQFNSVRHSEIVMTGLSNLLASAAKPAVVAVMMALLLAQPSEDAFAASSGGRMGGKAFSSRPSTPSRSYSGGESGGGRSYSGGGGGIYAAPPIYASPYGFSPFGYSPFYGGGYGGGLFFGPSIGFGGGGTVILAMIAFATLRAVVGFVRDRFSGDRDDDRFDD